MLTAYIKAVNITADKWYRLFELYLQMISLSSPLEETGSRKRQLKVTSWNYSIWLSLRYQAQYLARSSMSQKMLFFYCKSRCPAMRSYWHCKVIVPNMDSQCPILCYLGENFDHIRRNWLLWFLLAASRHLSLFHGEQHISDLRRALSSDDISLRRTGKLQHNFQFPGIIMLCDMHMASKHVRGAITIVRDSGGIDALGLSEIVRCAYLMDSLCSN
ncbi:hypothetical protein CCUS01_06266 [Colletotrichum cuscutae]|uniref:Uncharacterized protein n=1 Tax=Colletotrichum cuscutae TaxID=1209917 RepID=A0AAI9V4A9_9PEZI|nr:hypothetical protein CCUS01_06266 [Colletotrichum cuscutae]